VKESYYFPFPHNSINQGTGLLLFIITIQQAVAPGEKLSMFLGIKGTWYEYGIVKTFKNISAYSKPIKQPAVKELQRKTD